MIDQQPQNVIRWRKQVYSTIKGNVEGHIWHLIIKERPKKNNI